MIREKLQLIFVIYAVTMPLTVEGGWNAWISGQCQGSCGIGKQVRTRSCSSPPCQGNRSETSQCQLPKACAAKVDGSWSVWVDGKCSLTCGQGTVMSTRTCTSPKPSGGGKLCAGVDQQAGFCNITACKVNGGWSDWEISGLCTVTCGNGTQMRNRTCTKPAPSGGGSQCEGAAMEAVLCTLGPCVVNGGWTNWAWMAPCSTKCGPGVRMQTRKCTHPTPSGGGAACVGPDTKSVICNVMQCEVDGGWSTWVNGKCTTTCGPGSQRRTRSCTNPSPSGGGLLCQGQDSQTVDCSEAPC